MMQEQRELHRTALLHTTFPRKVTMTSAHLLTSS